MDSAAAGAAFKDAWTFEDTDDAWWGEIAEAHPALYKVIDAAGAVGGRGAKAYLIYMAVRLLEMQRILKETGSLYLHCNPTMSHSLKLLLDAIFGGKNFCNEIVWRYDGPQSPSKKKLATKHDVLLFYVKNAPKATHHQLYHEIQVHERATRYQQDSEGRWFYTTPKGDYTPGSIARLAQEGRVYRTKNDKVRIKYFVEKQGAYFKQKKKLPDVWNDIPSLGQANPGKQKRGYPTQKPLALLERILEIGTKHGDVVLDPFCGCATTCIAAEKLGRQWLGIDISELSATLVKERMRHEVNLGDANMPALLGRVIHRSDLPIRDAPKPSRDLKRVLFGRQRGYCKGCKHDFPYQNLTTDHIVPTTKGGPNTAENLQLLCHFCNSLKGNRLTMPQLHATLKKRARWLDASDGQG